MEHQKMIESTPSSCKNPLVEKVRFSNINCDSPFRLLPNVSTPPSRMFKIRNPFESPLIERLHLPVCSPGLFRKSTPKLEEKFKWSICEISNLKPAEIDTNYYQENICSAVDPQTESLIQDKISSFFRQNAIVPSPASNENTERKYAYSIRTANSTDKTESLCPKRFDIDAPLTVLGENAMEISYSSEEEVNYLPEEEYYKKLFDFDTSETSPPVSQLDSPVQFSPPKALIGKSFSDEMEREKFKECGLSPITPENETSQKDNSKNSTRESKSACRLIFSEDSFNVEKSSDFNPQLKKSFEATVRESGLVSDDLCDDNSGIMSIEEVEIENMDVSLIHTPKTGLFTSQRKRLSDSFNDLHSSFSQLEELKEVHTNSNTNNKEIKTRSLPEGSSDMGYHSANIQPSLSENTWNNSQVFSSTPTKRKNEALSKRF